MAFEIKIVSKNGTEFESEVDSVTLPAKDGYITILKNHASLITSLNPGTITARFSGSKEKNIDIKGGFSEINDNKLTVLINYNSSIAKSDLIACEYLICDWSHNTERLGWLKDLGIKGEAVSPMLLMSIEDNPVRQLERAKKYHQQF